MSDPICWRKPCSPRRIARAIAAVIREAHVRGVSTRNVDEIVRALGVTGLSSQSVSRLCAELDE